jgi:hypothetical protein
MTTEEAMRLFGEVMRDKRLGEKRLREAERKLSEALAEWSRATTAEALMRMIDERTT